MKHTTQEDRLRDEVSSLSGTPQASLDTSVLTIEIRKGDTNDQIASLGTVNIKL